MRPSDTMSEIAAQFGPAGLDRIEVFLRGLAGEIPVVVEDDEQEPNRLYFPGLRARPWWDPVEVAGLDVVESRYDAVLGELRALERAAARFVPYEDPSTGELGWSGWDTYSLFRFGAWRPGAREQVPHTVAALGATAQGPRQAMFTTLAPGSRITPHTGGINLVLTCHLGLVVPPGCGIAVAGTARSWEAGRGLAFDDSFMHEAWNDGEAPRSVLLWDVWHPDLTRTEIDVLLWTFARHRSFLLGGREPIRPETASSAEVGR